MYSIYVQYGGLDLNNVDAISPTEKGIITSHRVNCFMFTKILLSFFVDSRPASCGIPVLGSDSG